MKKIIIFNIFLCSLLILVSCNKDFLDLQPKDEFSELAVFKDPSLTEAYVNDIYLSIASPMSGGGGMLKGEFVDEAHDMWYSYKEFNQCLLTQDYLADWTFEYWDNLYSNIRKCNVFFEKADFSSYDNTLIDGKTLKDKLRGEVFFLRAFFYHQLVSLYGGVPIVDKTYALTDNFKIARNTYAESIDFIVADCDSAASLLPDVNTDINVGLAAKGTAMALKSEVLLYAASDLHNNNSIFSGFSNPALLGYIDGNSQERWLAAKKAAKDLIDLNLYSLFRANPSPGDSVTQNIVDLFLAKQTEEDIFVRFYLKKDWGGNNLPLATGPNGFHLYGQDTPTGNLVDDYEMADGTNFSWINPEHAATPYKNRDPRFYASILYDGSYWKQRTADVIPLDPTGCVQTGNYETWDAASNSIVLVFGLDTRNSPIEYYNGGYTGYYLRKFVDPAVEGQYSASDVPWRYLRYAEVLLNYAEACIELHEDAEARIYLNMIRKRAGMPDITESGDALRERYRHERRIELALEGNRFYDVRRWVIGPLAYVPATGVDILYKLDADKNTSKIPVVTPKVIQERSWIDKAYFFPIMRTEINKNDLLVQNPGY
jgi:starch-binding outer membrane protein, SusD/RagB family